MANGPRKIKISNGIDSEDDNAFDVLRATDTDDDDEPAERAPINLDSPVGLAEALAGVSALPPEPEPQPVKSSEAQPTPIAYADPTEVVRLKEEVAAANNNYLRALADLQNFRRRGEEEHRRIIRDANERLIKELLPVLDDFDLAMTAARQSESYEQLIGGVDAILRKLRETLQKQGVGVIEAVGQKFNPDLHEAVMVDSTTDAEEDTVTAELRKGYTLHERVIRPTLVKVAQ